MSKTTEIPAIDWSGFDFSEDTCYCRCGEIYRSHTKYVGEISLPVSRIPCPSCGSQINMKKISGDQETMQL